MIKVDLVAHTNIDPLILATLAGKTCYTEKMPEVSEVSDFGVEEKLFKVGHHTTLEHYFLTFTIKGIAVSDITFGMHLASPFYNSDQRSGRFCAKMFLEPDFGEIENYIHEFWPQVKKIERGKVMAYIKNGVGIYHKNISEAAKIAGEFLKKERPFANEKYVDQGALKISQEQMRMFISTIFPTAFYFTVDLIALVSLYESAWMPGMKEVTQKMADAFVEKFPQVHFMFNPERRRKDSWAMDMPKSDSLNVKYIPSLNSLGIIGEKNFIVPDPEKMHPVDKLHFLPEMMDNSADGINVAVEISTATMGQDQRHRTIGRSQPKFSGNFYLPPILRKMKMESEAKKLMRQWIEISKNIPKSLAMAIAPYGAMVKYQKRGSFNAVLHEQAKRLCFCAQEEIYHLGKFLRMAIEKKKGKKSKLLRMLEPPCYRNGKCAEGGRYCGRDIKLRKSGDYFPKRVV
jgi:thymidylate synthase ThyX